MSLENSQMNTNIALVLGLIIGLGGLNEWTGIGMAAFIGINSKQWARKIQSKYLSKDATIICLGLLCGIFWWLFNPSPVSASGITLNEILKVTIWICFTLTLTRTPPRTFYATLNGISYGILIYASTMLTGSLFNQDFQTARGLMYNYLTGNIDASSSITSYACCTSTLILLGTRNRVSFLSALVCIGLGAHTLNRAALIVGISSIICLAINSATLFAKNRNIRIKSFSAMAALTLAIPISAFAITKIVNYLDITRRFQQLLSTEPRLYMYSAGYRGLIKAIIDREPNGINNIPNTLIQMYPNIAPSDLPLLVPGWHSLPLDSLRGAGIIGFILSIVWLSAISIAIAYYFKRKDAINVYIGIVQICILMTSMPVALGHYELLGALTLTTFLIYEPGILTDTSQKKAG